MKQEIVLCPRCAAVYREGYQLRESDSGAASEHHRMAMWRPKDRHIGGRQCSSLIKPKRPFRFEEEAERKERALPFRAKQDDLELLPTSAQCRRKGYFPRYEVTQKGAKQ